ncbi:hypothetical protein [Marinoscillum sp. MHG1-6]|uniref:hypothetical protein n=1 Tax=Marinoscillum sp. MHG1-6 TaxID=2959627 RepID=UPI002157EB04|nr:hypothetical protein [Marinoscillum sp. MHG1-6]
MRILFLLILLIINLIAFCQDANYRMGATNAALGGASVTIADSWSIFNNVGAIGRITGTQVAAGYQNRYDIHAFQVKAATLSHHFNSVTSGISYFKFGDDFFNQQKISLAIGNQIQMVSLGIGANVVQYHIEGLGTKRRFALEFGGVAEIFPKLYLGAHIFNFRESKYIPTNMKAGMSYRPNDQVMINIETEKEIGFKEQFKAGIQYQIIHPLFFRTGLSTYPFKSAFGLGLLVMKFNIDYCFSSDNNLGPIHELSLAYNIHS